VGLPYDLYGKDRVQLEKTQKFIEKLKNIFPQKDIIGIDERFSTFEARFSQAGNKNVDDISASIILDTYLHTK